MAISEKMRLFAARSSWIREILEEGAKIKAAHGAENVFDFSLGNPDVPPPEKFNQVIQEIVKNGGPGMHAYMPNGGYPWVREIIAARMSLEQGITIDQAEVLMTCGAAGGLNVVLKALLDPGDEVIILAPHAIEYEVYIDNHGGVSRTVATDEQFNLDLTAIEAALSGKTKAIIINSPNNPCGQIYPEAALADLGRLLGQASTKFGGTIYLISDEPYRKIVFNGHDVPGIFPAYANSIVVSSYSKGLSLPGERIGYVTVHPEAEEKQLLLGSLTLANRMLFVNAPALMQRVVAELPEMSVDSSIYAGRKKTLCKILAEAGFEFTEPKGAFYVFPKTPLKDDVKFVKLLQDEKILAIPGAAFGSPGHMRLAFCLPEEQIAGSAEAFKRAVDRAKSL